MAKAKKSLSFYVAGKVGKMEGTIQDLLEFIRSLGHTISFDWTRFNVSKPYGKNRKRSALAAEKMAKGVMNADVVIVLTDEKGLGLHIETGGALVSSLILEYILGKKHKAIFVVGEHNARSVFYYHTSVRRIPTITALKKRLIAL